MPEEIDILIHKGLIVTQDPEHHIYHDCDLAIKGERILAIGKALPYTAKKVIDGQRKLVMPGLVDPHMHETITRGICEAPTRMNRSPKRFSGWRISQRITPLNRVASRAYTFEREPPGWPLCR